MFESYFFDKRATINYQVYRVLKALEDQSFTINRVSQEAGLSYSQAYNAFQEIISDLQRIHHVAIDTVNEAVFKELGGAVTADQYRFHLLNENIAFQFFVDMFLQRHPDVHQFCQARGLSISTLRRRVEPFKAYLLTKGLQLNPSTWALEGPELQIRLVMSSFYLLAFRGNGWPFGPKDEAKTQAAFFALPRTDAIDQPEVSKQDLIMFAVQRLRLEQGHPLPAASRLGAVFADSGLPVRITKANYPELTAGALAAEAGFDYFGRLHFMSIQLQPAAADHWLLTHLAKTNNPIHRFAAGLFDVLMATATRGTRAADPTQHVVLAANLHRVAMSYYVLEGDFSKRLDFYPRYHNDVKFGRLPQLITDYIMDLPPDAPEALFQAFLAPMRLDLYAAIHPDFPALDADHLLQVTVLVEAESYGGQKLRKFLSGVDFITVTPSTAPPGDVVITSLTNPQQLILHYQETLKNPPVVIPWQTTTPNTNYYRLYNQLRTLRDAYVKARSEEAAQAQ